MGARATRGTPEIVQMELPYLPPIPHDLEGRIAVIFGTTELHPARDYHSFTRELNKVVSKENGSLAFASIAKKVNQSWARRNIRQRCKEDIVQVGDNWADFMWPSSVQSYGHRFDLVLVDGPVQKSETIYY